MFLRVVSGIQLCYYKVFNDQDKAHLPCKQANFCFDCSGYRIHDDRDKENFCGVAPDGIRKLP